MSSAQVYRNETPPPLVNAAGATWQLNGEPIFHEGNFYYPAGATVYFDGKIMVRTGVYAGVPVYADVTLEPFSMVYIPIGGLVMRPYERRREGELAGTVGSRTPSFPIQRDVELSASSGTVGLITPAVTGLEQEYRADTDFVTVRVPVSALGRSASAPAPPAPPTQTAEFQATGVVSVTATQAAGGSVDQAGLWIEFNGARWYSAGRAVDYDSSRFEPVGDYRGFPVYRDRSDAADRLYVTVVHDGPVAPFARR